MAERARRRLTDSEARYQAIVLIDATVRNAISSGCLHQPDKWTDDDAIAIEKHAMDRVDGLLRRPRKGATDGG